VSCIKSANITGVLVVLQSVVPDHPERSSPMTDETVRRLQALDDEYTAAVNTAIAEDRMDLVQRLADEYPEAAAEVMDADAA